MAILDFDGLSYFKNSENNQIAPVETSTVASTDYPINSCFWCEGNLCRATANILQGDTLTKNTNYEVIKLMDNIFKYNDICRIVKIANTGTTLGDIASQLNTINAIGDHVFFDLSQLGVMMYLCTIYIDTANNVYKVFDLVSGRYAEGTYSSTMLLTMATAQANGLAVQSQIDYLQQEIDELGGKSVFANWDVLGDLIQAGTSTDLIEPGDTTDINWIASVLGTTTRGLTVVCTDMDAFINGVGEAEAKDYLFVYDGANWTYDGNLINLTSFGLSVSGTPVTGEVMDIKTTVNSVSYTFTGYDDIMPSDSGVAHNWVLEQTYAPSTKAYDTYEALFSVYAGKTIPVGNYHLRNYCYRSAFYVDMYINVTNAIGDSNNIVQMRSTGYTSNQTITNADNVTKTGVYTIKGLSAKVYGENSNGTGAATIAYASTEGVTYTELTALNVDANDPVVFVNNGQFDKCVFGDNCWPMSNMVNWLNSEAPAQSTYAPTHLLDSPSGYNMHAGFLWGIDPRVKALIQYADIQWTSGYGNTAGMDTYIKATGTAPSTNAPTYYERGGTPGNRTYTALDPQPSAGADVSSYYVYTTEFTRNTTYTDEERVFLLSMKEMSFNINTAEGNITDLYGIYTDNTLTNNAVADRAKYNKSGGTLNSYRWSRSAFTDYAYSSRLVTSSGSSSGLYACDAYYFAPAFIIGKSAS